MTVFVLFFILLKICTSNFYSTRCVATSPMGSTTEYSAAMAVRASSKDRFAGVSSTPVYVSPSPKINLVLGQFR